ncbi:sphinganine c-4-hydroxylase [Wickerhamomyces ciferrii]|uniref:Sphinganine c-4-hydroxylase n=2 Tax=Wickerhamomyces ciferrii TaxID=1041607 RepID=K0KYX1_WICCF|nr:sphinganine c-4-hydroxylase [Wickerhamomyces ciferrii]AAN77731.1 sphinganine hydroxylase [Wickerhamomyces ciferrii]ADW79431.1 sphinganine c-4-hydroxylase [Wickerhamomyces ciferrii]CCH46263.1 sphinganine c-4-hydroxylase [Wickerhamomyces ciferrii]
MSSHQFLINQTTLAAPPVHLVEKPSLINGIPDNILALIAPVIAYYSYSGFFYVIDTLEIAELYRIHPPEEVSSRNKATKFDVLKDVVLQHFIQSVVGYIFTYFDPIQYTGDEEYQAWKLQQTLPFLPFDVAYYWNMYGWSCLKIGLAFLIIDSWQYWLHRIMHLNKTLYKRFHSRHHRLYVPYAFGALYNDPFEGFLLDTLGTGIAAIVTQLTPRESIVLYTFSTLKTVDDHCGYSLPYDPFQILFPNNSIYHDIHHQQFGIKTNFSQPFFTHWDVFSNTRYKEIDEYREKQKAITIAKYKEFLHDREIAKQKKKAEIYKDKKTD